MVDNLGNWFNIISYKGLYQDDIKSLALTSKTVKKTLNRLGDGFWYEKYMDEFGVKTNEKVTLDYYLSYKYPFQKTTLVADGSRSYGYLNKNIISITELKCDEETDDWETEEPYQLEDKYIQFDMSSHQGCGAGVLTDGTVKCWGEERFNRTNVPYNLKNIKQVACGIFHTVALCRDNSIVGWGAHLSKNSEGKPFEIQKEQIHDRVIKILTGSTYNCVYILLLLKTGEIQHFTIGDKNNMSYHVPKRPENTKFIDVVCSNNGIYGLLNTGDVIRGYKQSIKIEAPKDRKFIQISAKGDNFFGLLDNNEVFWTQKCIKMDNGHISTTKFSEVCCTELLLIGKTLEGKYVSYWAHQQ